MVQKGVEIVSQAIKADGEKNYELAFTKYAAPHVFPMSLSRGNSYLRKASPCELLRPRCGGMCPFRNTPAIYTDSHSVSLPPLPLFHSSLPPRFPPSLFGGRGAHLDLADRAWTHVLLSWGCVRYKESLGYFVNGLQCTFADSARGRTGCVRE
jgi:hypothetical protein